MKILHAASECFPLIKTGGLADVVGALPLYQQNLGCDARVILPFYSALREKISETHAIFRTDSFAGDVTLRYGEYQGLKLYLIDAPHLYNRDGNPYYDCYYRDYADNCSRFALLSWAAAAIADGADQLWGKADILHAHDWQTGLAAAYLRHWGSSVQSVFTIHNIAYQGVFIGCDLAKIWLDPMMFQMEGLEFYGNVSFLKAGIFYSDQVSTVSPTYAAEITRYPAGNGMEGLLAARKREKRLTGILNGIDSDIWNPATDELISKNFTAKKLANKKICKNTLRRNLGLNTRRRLPLIVMISRLAEQKGADLLARNLENRLDAGGLNFQFVILGSGEKYLEDWFNYLAWRDPKNIAAYIGYNESLSHEIVAAADAIVIPSRFEPCGLTQLYGLAYGALPIVRRTGGLADTVFEGVAGENGFVFNYEYEHDLGLAIDRFLQTWKNQKQFEAMQTAAMQEEHSWEKAANNYLDMYLSFGIKSGKKEEEEL
ncbi:MAG: glycogen synthase GlgA [Cardiobacteriaceae bacterium]|nr:glycogen synthase GlgA [Cardiobacteriaceae bacterium]